MGFDALSGFQVGQQLGEGQSALGAVVKSVMERIKSNQDLQNQFGLQAGLERQKSALELQNQQSLIPLKEASASRLLQEKAKLFPPQPKPLSGETAGRLSLSVQGNGNATRAKQLLFPNGTPDSMNRGLLVAVHSPWGMGMIGNQDAQSLEFAVERAIDAQLRIETGATARPEELKRMTKQFLANATANPQATWDKLSQLEQGLWNTANYIDPTGNYRKSGSSPFDPSNNEDLSSVSDEDILRGAGLGE